MTFERIGSRIKAAALAAVMAATVVVSSVSPVSIVTAAETTNEISVTLEASSSTKDDAPNKAKIPVPADATTVTFNFETDAESSLSFGVYGAELKKAPWWGGFEDSFDVTPEGGKGSFTVKIPETADSDDGVVNIRGIVKTLGIGLWYPKSDVTVNFTSITHDGSDLGSSGPGTPLGPQVVPTTGNTKSGTWEIIDNKDGTATIRTTLTAEVNEPDMDYLLTYNHDEESYMDDDGDSTYKEGDPINSHKFSFDDFGLEDLSDITIQSFNYTITCDRDMETFQYGGGINVEPRSPADTEYAKGKNGYWYNDQGDRDINGGVDETTGKEYPPHKEELDALGIKYNEGGYTVENAGQYAEIVWDVPVDVQPYVSKNNMDTVGIQFWYAADANPPEEEGYAAIEEVHLKAASCTYTREMTVPYTTTANQKVGTALTPGKGVSFDLSKLGLENDRSFISAVKFNLSVSDLKKIQTGVGISVADTNPAYDGWYMPNAGLTVLEPDSKVEIMWIVPEQIRRDVYDAGGKLEYALWYAGDSEGNEVTSGITLDSIDFYEFITREETLTVEPDDFTIEVGEEKKLDINVDDCKFDVSNDVVVSVSPNGTVTGLGPGISAITVTTPEGQEKEITVRVVDKVTEPPTTEATTTTTKATTTKATTTTKPTTKATTTVTTTRDPREPEWDKVLYGDVNLDGIVNVSDVVALNMYLLNKGSYPLKNATAKENADCLYDYKHDLSDSTLIMNYCVELIAQEQLGPKEGDVLHKYWPLDD